MTYDLSVVPLQLVLIGFSGGGEKQADFKSGQDLDPDKPGCTTSCW